MTSTSTILLTPSQCRQARETLAGNCSAKNLLELLAEAEILAIWLRDQVSVELPAAEMAKMREIGVGITA